MQRCKPFGPSVPKAGILRSELWGLGLIIGSVPRSCIAKPSDSKSSIILASLIAVIGVVIVIGVIG